MKKNRPQGGRKAPEGDNPGSDQPVTVKIEPGKTPRLVQRRLLLHLGAEEAATINTDEAVPAPSRSIIKADINPSLEVFFIIPISIISQL